MRFHCDKKYNAFLRKLHLANCNIKNRALKCMIELFQSLMTSNYFKFNLENSTIDILTDFIHQ